MTAAEVGLHEVSWDHLAHIPSTSGGDWAEKNTKDEGLGQAKGWGQYDRGWGEKDPGQDYKGWGETNCEGADNGWETNGEKAENGWGWGQTNDEKADNEWGETNDKKADNGWGGDDGWGVETTKEQGVNGWDASGPSLADWAVVDNMESLMQKFIIVWRETVADGLEHPDEELVLPSMAEFLDNPPKTPPREVPAVEGWDTVESGWNVVTPKAKRGKGWGGFNGNRNRPNDKTKSPQKLNGAKGGTGRGNNVRAWDRDDQWDDSKPKKITETGDPQILNWRNSKDPDQGLENEGALLIPVQETDLWASKAEPRDLWKVPKPVHPQPGPGKETQIINEQDILTHFQKRISRRAEVARRTRTRHEWDSRIEVGGLVFNIELIYI